MGKDIAHELSQHIKPITRDCGFHVELMCYYCSANSLFQIKCADVAEFYADFDRWKPAGEKFLRAGWGIHKDLPICPKCQKHH